MSASCCTPQQPPAGDSRFRRVLWIALVVNAAMFAVEIVSGLGAHSTALLADAVDFFGDAANYAVSLFVLPLGLLWRARAAMLKAWSMAIYGVVVFGYVTHNALNGVVPEATTMGIIGVLALCANSAVAIMLYRFRSGDSNMRSVWLCSRNDAIGNIAVVIAALGVFGTGTGWPDFIVAAIMASLALSAGTSVLRQARRELRELREAAA